MSQDDKNYPIYLFHEGTNYESYKLMSPTPDEQNKAWRFRVWAPHAVSVGVVGNFNDWDRSRNLMEKVSDGIWETRIEGLKDFDIYKYSIETRDGRVLLKADPYALHAETAPATASKLYASRYVWGDKKWLKDRESYAQYHRPIKIY